MSYQVLARKWRPRSFETLVGQEHVVRALTHALEQQRLHHAYLFTGTRGVGKTTLARILAKALNCETGITSKPCGQCGSCLEIDTGRFVDLIEVDAATNTRVDEMRQLLENAAYAPTRGRFKVYVIDEVHMLSTSAFNAMLKTLEEPPEHVKFILATTDPQKIPVTVLSRCLQFNLKQMPQHHIVEHLTRILEAETVFCEPPALRHLAKAAAGSMRDALSLLDQAIAHGAGRVEEVGVRDMLGTVGEDHLYAILDALIAGDVVGMLAVADAMTERSLSFDSALQELGTLVHRIALVQFAPEAIADDGERARLLPYGQSFDPEFLQLCYQIVTHGRGDLSLAPEEYAGFTMTLLRLAAFKPEQPGGFPTPVGGGASTGKPEAAVSGRSQQIAAKPIVSSPTTLQHVAMVDEPRAQYDSHHLSQAPRTPPPVVREGEKAPGLTTVSLTPLASDSKQSSETAVPLMETPGREQEREGRVSASVTASDAAHFKAPVDRKEASTNVASEVPAEVSPPSKSGQQPISCNEDWHQVLGRLSLGGMVRELARHCEFACSDGANIQLRLSRAHQYLLSNRVTQDKLQSELQTYFGSSVRLLIEAGELANETPAQRMAVEQRERHEHAVITLGQDKFVRDVIDMFDATLDESSIKSLSSGV